LVTVEAVPKAGQSDLYYLTYEMDVDLAITVENVNIDPINAPPDSGVTITITVENIGESPAPEVEVVAYDCDLQDNCTLIEHIQIILGAIDGGGESGVTVPWIIPVSNEAHKIKVVVDPNFYQEDRDRTNNSVEMVAMRPDLAVREMEVQNAGDTRLIRARIANEGSLPTENVGVVIRRDDTQGSVLHTVDIPVIQPGAYKDVSFTWVKPVSSGGTEIKAYAVIDEAEAIDEVDEDNNVSTLLVDPIECPCDLNDDGNCDMLDWLFFGQDWGRTDCNDTGLEPCECDINGDGNCDMLDWLLFGQDWGRTDCPAP
jgi:hypothetical protein